MEGSIIQQVRTCFEIRMNEIPENLFSSISAFGIGQTDLDRLVQQSRAIAKMGDYPLYTLVIDHRKNNQRTCYFNLPKFYISDFQSIIRTNLNAQEKVKSLGGYYNSNMKNRLASKQLCKGQTINSLQNALAVS